MKLIGMLDSPYVRRVAICLEYMNIPFEHESVSVFSDFEKFRGINPLVKAPTLVFDDGDVMMESSMILQYIEKAFHQEKTLWPTDTQELQKDFRAVSLALAACEKGAQIVYETNLRPEEKQHTPWLNRVGGQLLAALGALETEVVSREDAFAIPSRQATIMTAIAWQFLHSMVPEIARAEIFPALVAHSEKMELMPQFKKYPPDGPGVPSPNE